MIRIEKSLIAEMQGDWDWEYMQVVGKPGTRTRDYYATSLRVQGTQFGMRFSEAACGGDLVWHGDTLVLQPDSLDKAQYGYEDAEMLRLKDDKLFILYRKQCMPLDFGPGIVDVIHCYRRRRQ